MHEEGQKQYEYYGEKPGIELLQSTGLGTMGSKKCKPDEGSCVPDLLPGRENKA